MVRKIFETDLVYCTPDTLVNKTGEFSQKKSKDI